ncbi:MAG: DUF126 domain-containing protein [Candidatus Hydrothermarchaeales archaeon]
MRIKGRATSKGIAEGEVLSTDEAITFLGGVDPETGIVVERGHELEGKSVAGKVLVFPRGKGSTVGSYVIYGLKKNGKAPAAIINLEAEEIVATGAILANIPMLDSIEKKHFKLLKSGMNVLVNADEGYVEMEDSY